MADWPLLDGQRWQQGVNQDWLADVLGSASTPNTKGAWSELIATTSFPASGIIVTIGFRNAANFLVDIGIGAAGYETTIINNILATSACGTGGFGKGVPMFFPISVPNGTRIAARCQADSTINRNCGVGVQIVGGGFAYPSSFSKVLTYGAYTANSRGTNVDPGGSADTKGAWTEIAASISNNLKTIMARFGDASVNYGNRSNAQGLIDIGIGASGNEIVVIPNIYWSTVYLYGQTPDGSLLFPISIPSGSRLVARASSQATAYRTVDVVLYGLA